MSKEITARCPLCGSALDTNDVLVWCTFVGGGKEKACDFGLNYDITIDGLDKAIKHEARKKEVPIEGRLDDGKI